jgi:pimeloyl-ACP methyl ester carboxylesterase
MSPTLQFCYSKDQVPIAFQQTGQGLPTFVFVHGWACNQHFWEKQVRFFKEMATVVTLDLAGHGASGLARSKHSIGAFANDVIAVIKALGLEHIILVGHSMGGYVIITAACKLSVKIKAVVGVDTYKSVGIKYTQTQIKSHLTLFEENYQQTTREYVQRMFLPTTDRELKIWVINQMINCNPKNAILAKACMFQFDLPGAMADLSCPLLSINATQPATDSALIQQYHPGFQLQTIDGTGHFVMLENPIKFNELLLEISKSLPQ